MEATYGIFTLYDVLVQGTYASKSPFVTHFRLQFESRDDLRL